MLELFNCWLMRRKFFLDNTIYESIKCIQHSKYHVHPYGFMTRISVNSYREQVRVSKEAVRKGLNFSKIGAAYIKQYCVHKAVKSSSSNIYNFIGL